MYIWQELFKHKLAYAVLLLILAAGFVAFTYWAKTSMQQQLVIVGFAVSYFMWGITTHVKSDHLTRTVIQEYAGIAVLGALLLLLLTF